MNKFIRKNKTKIIIVLIIILVLFMIFLMALLNIESDLNYMPI
jgi:cytochrome c-type biogenesis protein CcmE